MDDKPGEFVIDLSSSISFQDSLNLDVNPFGFDVEDDHPSYLSDDTFKLVNEKKRCKGKKKGEAPSMTRSKSHFSK